MKFQRCTTLSFEVFKPVHTRRQHWHQQSLISIATFTLSIIFSIKNQNQIYMSLTYQKASPLTLGFNTPFIYKKVLLLSSRVARARYAAMSRGVPWPGLDGGIPIPGWGVPQSCIDGGGTPSQGGGYPGQVLMWGVPQVPPRDGIPPGMGYPIQDGVPPSSRPSWGTPPTIQTWMGYPPRPEMGYPPTIQTWMGYSPEMLTDKHL